MRWWKISPRSARISWMGPLGTGSLTWRGVDVWAEAGSDPAGVATVETRSLAIRDRPAI